MKDTALIELFLNELWLEKGLSDNTVQSYRLDLLALSDWLSSRQLTFIELDAVDLQTFLGERLEKGYKATSTSRLLSAVRKLFQYLYREKYRSDDPSAVLSSPKLPTRLPKYLTEQQVGDLLRADALLLHVRAHFVLVASERQRRTLRETVRQQRLLVTGQGIVRPGRRDEVARNQTPALMQQLEKRVLAIVAKFAPDDRARLVVERLAVRRHRFPVAFHFKLLQERRKVLQ